MSFAEQLRHYRERAGLTQEELAAKAGLTAKAISALERAERRSPYPQTVRALADALRLTDVERAYEECLALRRGASGLHTLAWGLLYLGLALTLARNPEGRAKAWRALQLLPEQGYAVGTIAALEVLAAQTGLRARHEEAALLVGAAQALRNTTGNTATTIHYADYNRLFDMARGSLDDASFAAACAAGQALSIEQALALAERVSVGE